MEGGFVEEGADILDRSGRQVVDHMELVAAREMQLGQMRADEPGASRDQNVHAVPPLPPPRLPRAVR
jgi:hypothetical protein